MYYAKTTMIHEPVRSPGPQIDVKQLIVATISRANFFVTHKYDGNLNRIDLIR